MKISVMMITIALALLLTAGCGGSSAPSPEPGDNNPQPAWTVTVPSAKKTSSPQETDTPDSSPTSSPSPSSSSTPFGPGVCRFYGEVTIDNNPAPDGTSIKAYIDSIVVANASTVGSDYQIYVTGHHEGKTVVLKVEGQTAESSTWETGGDVMIDLEIP